MNQKKDVKVIHILKDGTQIKNISKVEVPKETVHRVADIVRREKK